MSTQDGSPRKPLVVRPTQGRKYAMGRMRAIFLADGAETASQYSLFEWWLEPRTRGPGVHANPEDHLFYVLAGTLSLYLHDGWTDAPQGSYAVIPGGVPHDFENRGAEECGFLSVNVPGGFEEEMPALVSWFAENPPGDVAGALPAGTTSNASAAGRPVSREHQVHGPDARNLADAAVTEKGEVDAGKEGLARAQEHR